MKPRTDQQDLGSGGKIWEVAREWDVSPRTILDFSSNLNPLGPSLRVMVAIAQSAVTYYPDTDQCREALAKWSDVPVEQLVVGNGTSSLLFAAVRALKPKSALVIEPGFTEYTRALRSVEATIQSFRVLEKQQFLPDFEKLRRELKKDRFGVVVLNSPHNPTGATYPKKEVLEVIRAARKVGSAVILDESYSDYLPDHSFVQEAAQERNVIVLRSLTPLFSFAGLRVGYAVAAPPLVKAMETQMDRWPVSTVALVAACEAVNDRIFIRRSLTLVPETRNEFQAELTRIGCTVFPCAANFLLVKLPTGTASELAAWLAPHHVLIRTGVSFVGLDDCFMRLAVRSREHNRRFVELCEEWLTQTSTPPLKAKPKAKPKPKASAKAKPKPSAKAKPKAKPKPKPKSKTTPAKKRLKKTDHV